jgi:glycosyltransferase involved in cell wall biosynthesis
MHGVRYISPAESSGYGFAAQGYILSLIHAGVSVEWFPLVDSPHGYQPWNTVEGATAWIAGLADPLSIDGYFGEVVQRTLGRDVQHDTVIIHCTPEHWPRYVDPGKRNIGNTVWETNAPPPHWAYPLGLVDRLVVPSRFNASVFRDAGYERPIDVVPHVKRPDSDPPSADRIDGFRARHSIPHEHMVFYSIEAWTARKTPWKTIRAFLEAFTSDDPVSLVVKTGPEGPRSGAEAFNTPTEVLAGELVSHHEKPAHLVLINREIPSSDIELLHHLGDCYLSLTHSEGWGLSPFEAAAIGNPVIVTGWGGHLEHIGRDWPYLVDFELTPVMDAQGRGSYLPTQKWASPVMEHAVELIREVYGNRDDARANGAALAERIGKKFNEEVIGKRLADMIQGGT